jgi:magnesium chelatase family protein
MSAIRTALDRRFSSADTKKGLGTPAAFWPAVLAKADSAGVLGVDAFPVIIEVDVGLGLPNYSLVGLPDNAVKEGAVRVRAALENSGFDLPPRRVTINLAPADVRKDGAAFDLPIALALLAALEQLPKDALSGLLWLGELGFDGGVRRVAGGLPIALLARRAGYRGLVLPADCAAEAAAVRDLSVYGVHSLKEAVAALRRETPLHPVEYRRPTPLRSSSAIDLLDVRGNEQPKRALEIAAAGGHNLLFIGPPGTGKSMLARRLPGILPPMNEGEAIEVTSIYSAAGLLGGASLLEQRPFRAPHHDISSVGLVGGGSVPRPGEISLAHHGVLFLDELLEFPRAALEALRQPLEDREITIVRARCAVTYPASFSLVGALNPCPCGYRGSQVRCCTCDNASLSRYMGRLSGPLLDRFDLHVEVPHVDYKALLSAERTGEPSSIVGSRVIAARTLQSQRAQREGLGFGSNASLLPEQLLRLARPDATGEQLLLRYAHKHLLSSRAMHRVLRVARTIADLAQAAELRAPHIAEALSLRVLDRFDWGGPMRDRRG